MPNQYASTTAKTNKSSSSITESYYEKKRKEYRAEQKKIETKIAKLRFADEEYYLTSEYILKLASRASELFESSELQEKRLLLKMTLQNLELKGKKAQFDWIKPFDAIALHASRQTWLPLKDLFCNYKLEFGLSLKDLKIAFDELGLKQPKLAYATQNEPNKTFASKLA